MRILHTSDWHLGRSFHGVQLLDAQVTVLEAVASIVREEGVDVVVVAGDIYDRAIPSADAVSALSELLGAIRGTGAHVIGISGNHDSAERIGFAESVMSGAGVTLRGNLAAAGNAVVIPRSDGLGKVAFYPIPYIEVERARHTFEAPDARSHDHLLTLALDRARADLASRSNTRSVAIVHAFVAGGESCDSELALSVGGSAEVSLRGLAGFDYVALGHLHGRQSFTNGRVRYSGSPLPYSFSERGHTKGAWLIDLPAIGDPKVTPIDLPVHKSLHQVRGDLENLLTGPQFADAENGFVQAILTDQLLPLDAMGKLRRRFPHAVLLSHEPPLTSTINSTYAERMKGRTDLELACDFIGHVAGRAPTAREIGDLTEAIAMTLNANDHDDLAVA